MSLIDELKRRNVFRVGAAYLVGAWLLVEVSDTIFPRLGLPDWTVTLVIALLLLGLPVALFFAWAFELTPEGVKRTDEVAPEISVTPQTGRAIDRIILVGMVVVVAVIVADRFLFKEAATGGPALLADQASRSSTDSPAMQRPSADASTMEPANAATVEVPPPVMSGIAVLPFVNMSPDPENAYFADGISEELLNILAGIEGLKVASRTSAFSFKGKDTPIREIARLLEVQHVLEGSVRKQGQRVRITAQLIEAGNDAHLWSQTYERELVDIFQVQEDIAMAITTALEDILGTRQVSVKAPTRDLEAYQDFLRGRSSFYQRIDLDRAIDDLESAVERDPEFAEAWAFLAAATGVLSIGGWPTDRDPAALADREVSASERALELDPNIPIVLAGIGRRLADKGEVTRGLTMMERAARRTDPDTSPRLWLGIKLAELGHVDRALPWFESAHVQDPLVSINHGYLGYAYAVIGREEESVRIASRGLELNPLGFWMQVLALEAFHKGDMARFDELSLKISDAGPQGAEDGQLLESARAAVADPAKRDALFAPWSRESAEDTVVFLSLLVSDTERLFDNVGRTHLAGQRYMRLAAWLPSLGWLREDPRFYEFMRQSGAVEYWEAEGFPPGCRPVDDPAGGRLDCSEYSP